MLRRVALVRTDISELLVTTNVPSSLILVTLMMEAIRSYETSVLTKDTQRHNPEGRILHSHRREILKSSLENSATLHLIFSSWTSRSLYLYPTGTG
jgi:hypothetical protein